MDYEERRSLRVRNVSIALGMPIALLEVIDRLADSEGVRTTEKIIQLLRKALQVERSEREAAQAASEDTPAPLPKKEKKKYAPGSHWTQKPENRERVQALTARAKEASLANKDGE